jgi:hypothetical protein
MTKTGKIMPLESGRDARGPFVRWGKEGKRYYYRETDEDSRKRARARAVLQGRAIEASRGSR